MAIAGDWQAPMPEEPVREFQIADYRRILRQHRRLIIVVTCLSVVMGVVHYVITPRKYSASTTIQIEKRNLLPLGTGKSPLMDDYSQEFYPTQYKLLESRGLAERVVKNLGLMDTTAPAPKASPEPTVGPAPGAIATESVAKTPSTALAVPSGADEAALGRMAARLLPGLEVTPIRSTQLVKLAYQANDPQQAAKLANAFAEAFIDMGIENRSESAGKATSFLTSEIDNLKQEISDKEAQLQTYQKLTDQVALDPNSNVLLQRLEALNHDFADAVSERIDKEAKYNQVTSPSSAVVTDSLSTSLSGMLLNELRSDQMKLELDYATKLNTYKPEWPAMQSLKVEIEMGQKHLRSVMDQIVVEVRQQAKNDLEQARHKEDGIADEIQTLKTKTLDASSAQLQYNNLKVEIETRRGLLDELSRKLSESEVASRLDDTGETNVRIIDRALVPSAPFRPSIRTDLTYGLLAGLGLGLLAALLLERLDRTVKTPDEAERLLGLPVLSSIPDVTDDGGGYGYLSRYGYGYGARKKRRTARKVATTHQEVSIELIPHVRPRLAVAEAYRALRTALLLSSAEEVRLLALTSADAGEGKTSTAANLAVVMAQLGRQVLIVDGDLRKPRLHEVLKVSNRVGLVSYLTGMVEANEVVQGTELPNLSVVTSGPTPPNPSELLSSQRMREFVKEARARFDVVVFDTPPVLAVTDAILIGSLADGIVLCLRAGHTPREDAKTCTNRIRMAGLKVFGIVLNRYRPSSDSYGRKYHDYDYAESTESTPQPVA